MCERLGATYLGYSSFIRLVFKHKGKASHVAAIDIWAFHGKGGGGRMIGGSVNSVQHMAETAEADIFLSGHDHKKWAALKSKLTLTDGGSGIIRLKHKKILLGRTGSFLKGYEPGEESYVAKAGMSPTDLGVIKIELTPKRELGPKKDQVFHSAPTEPTSIFTHRSKIPPKTIFILLLTMLPTWANIYA